MKIYHSIILLSIVFFFSCKNNHSENEDLSSKDEAELVVKSNKVDNVYLTKEQANTVNIQLGDFSSIKINDFVTATGTLGLPTNALTSVSAKANGFIRNSNKYVEGSYIKKGVVMAYLENVEFIQHQREYLEISAELVFDRQELARQKELVASNAGIEKNVQRLESQINRKTATLQSIAKQLSYLGISVNDLSTNNIVQQVPIYSPTSGYLSSVKIHNGMYVTPQMELLTIINENHLHLELDIFEQNIASIKVGQSISYTIPALGQTIYNGSVYVIGKEFDTSNKTIRIHGHVKDKRPKFIKDLFVEAKIWLNNQTIQALPEKAISKSGEDTYIYITDGKYKNNELEFQPIRIITGATDNDFISVKPIDNIPNGMKIVTNGAYFVYAQSKAGELTE